MTPYLGSTVEIEVWSRAVAGFATKEGPEYAAWYADETLVHEQRNALLALTRGVPTDDPNLLRIYAALDEFAKALRG